MTEDFINESLAGKKTPKGDEIRIQLVNQSFIMLMRTSRDFRRFVWHMLGECGFGAQPFTGHRDSTDFNCGKLEAGRTIFLMIDQFCPEYFSIMMKEGKEDYAYDHGNKPTSSTSGSGPIGSGSTGSGNNAYDTSNDSIATIAASPGTKG